MDLWHWLLVGVAVIGLIYLGYSFYPLLWVLRLQSKAVVLMNAGQPDKAEALLQRAVRLAESRWDAPNTLPVLLNLASAIYLQEKYSEADSIATRMVELTEETYGPSHTLKAAALMT